jgi:hypothetical protein
VMFESGPDKYKALQANNELLRSTAEALRGHLYGEPGLLMTMPTRNPLHSAWRECLLFLNGDGDEMSGDLLVDDFFMRAGTSERTLIYWITARLRTWRVS